MSVLTAKVGGVPTSSMPLKGFTGWRSRYLWRPFSQASIPVSGPKYTSLLCKLLQLWLPVSGALGRFSREIQKLSAAGSPLSSRRVFRHCPSALDQTELNPPVRAASPEPLRSRSAGSGGACSRLVLCVSSPLWDPSGFPCWKLVPC